MPACGGHVASQALVTNAHALPLRELGIRFCACPLAYLASERLTHQRPRQGRCGCGRDFALLGRRHRGPHLLSRGRDPTNSCLTSLTMANPRRARAESSPRDRMPRHGSAVAGLVLRVQVPVKTHQ